MTRSRAKKMKEALQQLILSTLEEITKSPQGEPRLVLYTCLEACSREEPEQVVRRSNARPAQVRPSSVATPNTQRRNADILELGDFWGAPERRYAQSPAYQCWHSGVSTSEAVFGVFSNYFLQFSFYVNVIIQNDLWDGNSVTFHIILASMFVTFSALGHYKAEPYV